MLKPLGNRVIVKLDESQKTIKGIIIPTSDKGYSTGKVIAAGPGKRTQAGEIIPMTVHIDDDVTFDVNAGREYSKGVRIMFEDEIWGIND